MMATRRPIKLLAFSGATEWGGAEIVLGHLLAAFGSHIQPTLLGVDATITSRVASRRPGMSWSLVPQIRSKRDLGAIWAHRRAIALAKPDIVQVNLPVPFAEPYTVLAALTIPHLRVVVVEHLPMAIPWPGIRLLKRLTAPRLAAHIAVGSTAARQIEEHCGLASGSIRTVPNGVPLPRSEVDVLPPRAGLVIGAIGRLHHQKGFDVLIRAIAQLPDAHLILVGDGPERAALERLAVELGVSERIAVTGWTESAMTYLQSFDVLAIPSRYEGLPLVLLEAMLSGTAIVATGVGSIPDAVRDGETALLVPVDDAEALAVTLRRLRDDPSLRLRLGVAAAASAKRSFTVSAMVQAYEKIYEELLSP